MSLKDKRILLTGAAGGIGSLVTERLMQAGAFVTGIDRAEASECDHTIQGDLSTPAGIEAIASEVQQQDWDILVNLAGIQHFGPAEAQSASHTAASYMVNLVAPVMLTQALLPGMKARGTGQIINIGSVFGSINFAHFATYSSAKAGLKGFSDALRRELVGLDVGVTYIAPRAVKTALNSGQVLDFARITNMKMDDAADVADRIVAAIQRKEKTVYIGFPESLFVRVNAILPGLVDIALSGNDRKVRGLFDAPTQPVHGN